MRKCFLKKCEKGVLKSSIDLCCVSYSDFGQTKHRVGAVNMNCVFHEKAIITIKYAGASISIYKYPQKCCELQRGCIHN